MRALRGENILRIHSLVGSGFTGNRGVYVLQLRSMYFRLFCKNIIIFFECLEAFPFTGYWLPRNFDLC